MEEFVLGIRRQGTLIGASEQDMYMAGVAGLRPELKSQIMQFDPANLEDIIKRGKNAERYPIYGPVS